ncbi:FkbM family methyltransferase [Actinokineospora sp. NBRC 105648]|uniref:FkbM family methyltransferase n=1 Tax=Actinokineospora sp. NBRC 105648 TaxID=3032206 RepID=UPI0025556730|nr:FkbM family methyltransferase [Actinokineospora sp. NBRC 105648]
MDSLLVSVPAQLRHLAKRAALRCGVEISRNPFSRRLAVLCERLDVRAVLDVGANSGQYATFLRQSGFRGEIVSCEPVGDAYAKLERAAALDPGWHAERLALGERPGEVEVNVAGNSYSSSVLPMLASHLDAAPESGYVRVERAEMSTVDDVLARRGLRPEHTLLKIDVQGYEWEVLAGATAVLPRLAAVQAELSLTPLYAGQRLIGDITDLLSRHGLVLWAIEPGFCDPATGRMLQCDGVFVREGAA